MVRGKCPDQGFYIMVSCRGHLGKGKGDSKALRRGSKGLGRGKIVDEDLEPQHHWRWYPNIIIEMRFSEILSRMLPSGFTVL